MTNDGQKKYSLDDDAELDKNGFGKELLYRTEFGCSIPIHFRTSEGIKTMLPNKKYDGDLNEILE